MFTRVQNKYNKRIAYVVALNDALNLAELEFEDDKTTKFISQEQLYKNWLDLNTSNETNKKTRGSPVIPLKVKQQRKLESYDLKGTFDYIHNKLLEKGMVYYVVEDKTNTYYKYKLPESTMVQIKITPNKLNVTLLMRSTHLGYPLANSDLMYHTNHHYYNRALRIQKFTPTYKKLVDKIIDKLTEEPYIAGSGTGKENIKYRIKKVKCKKARGKQVKEYTKKKEN